MANLFYPRLAGDQLSHGFYVAFKADIEDGLATTIEHLVDGTLLDELALVHDSHAIADLLHVVQDMGGVKDGGVLP